MANVIVLFEVTVKEEKMTDYLERAGQLTPFQKETPGLIRAEKFSSLAAEGKLLSLSVWENEESVSQWRNLLAHRQHQRAGRMEDFVDYTITVVHPVRCYSMCAREEAPADSNQFFGA